MNNQKKELFDIYDFIKRLQQLKTVIRANLATEDRRENSAEHSWTVAMMAWFLSSEFQKEFEENIDINKVMKMALMHDIIEIEVADISVWDKQERLKAEKKEKEVFRSVIEILPSSLKHELEALWNEFEDGNTLESKIVRGVDRLSAALQRLVTKQGWVNENHTEEDLDNIQLSKIGFSNVLKSMYMEIKKESFDKGLLKK